MKKLLVLLAACGIVFSCADCDNCLNGGDNGCGPCNPVTTVKAMNIIIDDAENPGQVHDLGITRVNLHLADNFHEAAPENLIASCAFNGFDEGFQATLPATIGESLLSEFWAVPDWGDIELSPAGTLFSLKPVMFTAVDGDGQIVGRFRLGKLKVDLTGMEVDMAELFYSTGTASIKGEVIYNYQNNIFDICACPGWNRVYQHFEYDFLSGESSEATSNTDPGMLIWSFSTQ